MILHSTVIWGKIETADNKMDYSEDACSFEGKHTGDKVLDFPTKVTLQTSFILEIAVARGRADGTLTLQGGAGAPLFTPRLPPQRTLPPRASSPGDSDPIQSPRKAWSVFLPLFLLPTRGSISSKPQLHI